MPGWSYLLGIVRFFFGGLHCDDLARAKNLFPPFCLSVLRSYFLELLWRWSATDGGDTNAVCQTFQIFKSTIAWTL